MAIKLTKELLTDEAKNMAEEIKQDVTSTQLRKFYNDFLVLKSRADLSDESEFKEKILPLIFFSKAKLAYACGRETSKLPVYFAERIGMYIDRIETKDDFSNFINFYQAVIGYKTFIEKKAKEENKIRKENYSQNDSRNYSSKKVIIKNR